MSLNEESLQWYYTLRAAEGSIILRNHHTLLGLTNYKQISDKDYKVKKGIDKQALLRIINADIVSHAIKSIESLFLLANVGLLAKENGIFHKKMKKWYFFTRIKDLTTNMQIFKDSLALDSWKWILWIVDFKEIQNEQILTDEEINSVERIYDEYLERAQFVFSYSLKFWELFKPVRNAFSHTLRVIPDPNITHNMPEGFDDILLILDSDWDNYSPIKMPVATGFKVLKILYNLITNINLLEQSIIKNHTMSIQAKGKRLLPAYVLANVIENKKSDYFTAIIRKFNRFPAINVQWEKEDLTEELQPQYELYIEYWEKLKELGNITSHKDVKGTFFPHKKINQ